MLKNNGTNSPPKKTIKSPETTKSITIEGNHNSKKKSNIDSPKMTKDNITLLSLNCINMTLSAKSNSAKKKGKCSISESNWNRM